MHKENKIFLKELSNQFTNYFLFFCNVNAFYLINNMINEVIK